mmetsp:Transcript_9097/g.21780  ORF Transcript_9097/g.21780 Transcript_9097/m.21780 type:complete len:204 (+) Transcript_9097:604-1215(+)
MSTFALPWASRECATETCCTRRPSGPTPVDRSPSACRQPQRARRTGTTPMDFPTILCWISLLFPCAIPARSFLWTTAPRQLKQPATPAASMDEVEISCIASGTLPCLAEGAGLSRRCTASIRPRSSETLPGRGICYCSTTAGRPIASGPRWRSTSSPRSSASMSRARCLLLNPSGNSVLVRAKVGVSTAPIFPPASACPTGIP